MQLCDAGVIRSLKAGIREGYIECSSNMYANLNDASKTPFSDGKEVSEWLAQSWCQIPELCIQDTFQHIGLAKGLNIPPDTSHPNLPYPCISNNKSGVDNEFDVLDLN